MLPLSSSLRNPPSAIVHPRARAGCTRSIDGYRVLLHKDSKDIAIYSRNGVDFTSRFPAIAYVLAHLPTKSVIIEAEAVAVTAQGLPNFSALHRRAAKPEDICCYA